jgi:hypothetical protein
MTQLHQIGRIVLMVQALLLSALGLAGFLAAASSPTGVGHVAGFALNTPHSGLLLATGVVSGLTALWRRIGRRWAIIQAILYMLVFVIGTAPSNGRSEDTWLALSTALFWPAAPDHAMSSILPGDPPPAEQRPPTTGGTSEETRNMIDAEVAVTEGHATPEQARRVQEDAQHRVDAERRRAWKQSESQPHDGH